MKDLRTVKGLNLTLGILGIVYCIPGLGLMINLLTFHLPTIAIIVLSIIVLIKSNGKIFPKVGAILLLIGGIIGLISIVPLYIEIMNEVMSYGSYYSYTAFEDTASLYFMFMFVGWVVSVIGTVFAFIDRSRLTKLEMEALLDISQGEN